MTNRTYNQQDNLVTSIDVTGYPGLSFSYSYDKKNVTAEITGGVRLHCWLRQRSLVDPVDRKKRRQRVVDADLARRQVPGVKRSEPPGCA
ncbi:MAG: hypothetical protein GXP27_16755 [Planctomycetes bacterium]|nr:hypothetical protein [Planctomycetota bacterium]